MRTQHFLQLSAVLLTVSSAGAAIAAGIPQAQQMAQSGLKQSAQQQDQIDRLEDERSTLYFELSTVNRQIAQLETYNAHLQATVADQQQTMVQQEQRQQEIAELKQALIPLMYHMLTTLDQFYHQDVPFLTEEREQRLTSLQQMMTRSDVSDGEKFRRILQAYNIELEYGQTISQYQDRLLLDGVERQVTVTRIGRIALFAHIADGRQAWWFDSHVWQPLAAKGMEAIQTLSAQIERRGLPQMVTIPLLEGKHD